MSPKSRALTIVIALGASLVVSEGILANDLKLVVADGGGANGGNDLLKIVNTSLLTSTAIGTGTGTSNIESAVFIPTTGGYQNGTLYAVNENTTPNPDVGQFGTINLTTGVFSAIGSGIGSGRGLLGGVDTSNVLLDDIDGLTIDPFSNVMYGTLRRGSASDLLIQINPTTGAFVPNAFGVNQDFVELLPGTGNNADIDDISISPFDGQMYGIANASGSNDSLVRINKLTGAITTVGSLGVTDMEGLAFENNGLLWGTTGTSSSPSANDDSIWSIDPVTGVATTPGQLLSGGGGSDFEAVAGLLDDLNGLSGTMFFDANVNGAFDSGTESGIQGVTVRLYRDVNLDGLVDGGDVLLDTEVTNASGFYEWDIIATGRFVLDIDLSTVPVNTALTTDNLEFANFGTSFGAFDPNNNFGVVAVPEPSTYLMLGFAASLAYWASRKRMIRPTPKVAEAGTLLCLQTQPAPALGR